jgi:hypothetical protein
MSKRLQWTWKVVALAAALLVAGGSTAQAQKVLRWKFTPGQTVRYVMNQEQSQKIKAGTTPITMTMTMTMNMTQKIESVDARGVASVTQTIDRIQMKMTSPQGIGMEYDSASGKPPEGLAKLMAPMFDAMVKKPFTMKTDPQGKVSDMKLPQGFVESVNKISGNSMGGLFTEEGMQQMTGQGMAVLPEKPVSAGDTWTQQAGMAMPMLGRISVKNTYRYEGTEKRDGKELEKIDHTLKMDISPQKDKPQPFEIKMTDQKMQGTIYFDNEAGQLVETKTGGTMKMTISVGGQQIEQEIDMSQTLRLAPSDTSPKAAPGPEKP